MFSAVTYVWEPGYSFDLCNIPVVEWNTMTGEQHPEEKLRGWLPPSGYQWYSVGTSVIKWV